MNTDTARRRPRSLAHEVVSAMSARIQAGRLTVGEKIPTELEIMAEFAVSRTVVREALSNLQALGLVQTRHGVGTFVQSTGQGNVFRIGEDQFDTLKDVIAVLELRIGVEVEAASLAAARRTKENIAAMRSALDALTKALIDGNDAVAADLLFHQEIARATQNAHFIEMMSAFGSRIIPRARLEPAVAMTDEHRHYLQRVNGEHESIFVAIQHADSNGARAAMRTHLANSRERRRRTLP